MVTNSHIFKWFNRIKLGRLKSKHLRYPKIHSMCKDLREIRIVYKKEINHNKEVKHQEVQHLEKHKLIVWELWYHFSLIISRVQGMFRAVWQLISQIIYEETYLRIYHHKKIRF